MTLEKDREALEFLSTPSARRATVDKIAGPYDNILVFLSTPSARRATCCLFFLRQVDIISIHALREEGDQAVYLKVFYPGRFLSTPSARRATRSPSFMVVRSEFLSTPSARRATRLVSMYQPGFANFYPRPPRGGRL